MASFPCREEGCVGVTETEHGQCSPHAQGFRKMPKHGLAVRCSTCRRVLVREAWYRLVDGKPHHLRDCKPPVAAQQTGVRRSA